MKNYGLSRVSCLFGRVCLAWFVSFSTVPFWKSVSVPPKLVSGVTHHGGCFTEAEGLKVGEIWQKQTRITCKCHKGGTQTLILRQFRKIVTVKCFRWLEQLAFEFCMVHFPIDQFTRQSVETAVNTKLSKFSTPCDMFGSYRAPFQFNNLR